MITIDMKLRCLHRELALRKNTYAKWVGNGRMNINTAAHEIEVMESILADYQKIKDDENAKAISGGTNLPSR